MARGDKRTASVTSRGVSVKVREPSHEKPAKSAQECMRHDARSSSHALNGFLELFDTEALGCLNDEQRRAVAHMRLASERLFEITESALELAEAKSPLRAAEISRSCLVQSVQVVLYSVSRSVPETNITFASADGSETLPLAFAHEPLSKLLHVLLQVALSTQPGQLNVRLSRTDLHASLVLSARCEEASALSMVPIPTAAASTNLESMANAWNNREYVRLKRCESLLLRHKGRLLVAPDFSRLRVLLPIAAG